MTQTVYYKHFEYPWSKHVWQLPQRHSWRRLPSIAYKVIASIAEIFLLLGETFASLIKLSLGNCLILFREMTFALYRHFIMPIVGRHSTSKNANPTNTSSASNLRYLALKVALILIPAYLLFGDPDQNILGFTWWATTWSFHRITNVAEILGGLFNGNLSKISEGSFDILRNTITINFIAYLPQTLIFFGWTHQVITNDLLEKIQKKALDFWAISKNYISQLTA